MISVNFSQKIANIMLWASALITIAILFIMVGHILLNGVEVIDLQFLLESPKNAGREGGILPMIVSSLYTTGLALIVAIPLGIGSAIYLTEYAVKSPLTKAIRYATETLSGIPSIVVGLFGYTFFVIYLGLGFCVLSAGLTLSIMALPIIMRTAEESVRTVPIGYREGSLALGASKWQTIRKVLLPSASPGIVTGIVLGMGRAIGETAAIMFVVGGGWRIPISPLSPAQPLTVHLYELFSAGIISTEIGYGTATVLLAMVLAITFTANWTMRRYIKKIMGE